MYLDAVPKLYRLSPYQWQWTPEGEDAYVCQFNVVEVMTSTTDIPCREEMGIERRSRIRKVQFGDGYEQLAPDGINTETVTYSIETLPLSDTQATSLNTTLLSRKGNFFFSKLPDETVIAKYRLDDNRWSWNIQGKDANVFQFRLRKVYDL
jgi:phage-related protein